MPRQTDTYKLGYFLEGELTEEQTESRRFETIDLQLRGLYEMLGNGIKDGWDLSVSDADSFVAVVGSGSGVISFISVATDSNNTVGPFPAAAEGSTYTMYLYVIPTSTSYWAGDVTFVTRTAFIEDSEDSVFLAAIVIDENGITSIDIDDRGYIGFLSSITEFIRDHKHTGIDGQPDPIDLATDVEGFIPQANLPELDASFVQTGVLDKDRIPAIDHITGLENKGSLTHAQIDSFIQVLLQAGNENLGDTLLTNFLQLVLALKHQWPGVDEYLCNLIAFIPGISPDSFIDTENTTATVDTRPYSEGGTHTISGTPGTSYETFVKTWSETVDFEEAELDDALVGHNNIQLLHTNTNVFVEDFENVSDWNIDLIDTSQDKTNVFITDSTNKIQGDFSGKLTAGGETVTSMALVAEKNFTAQDWSAYNKIVFHMYIDNPQHGNIFFYVNDSNAGVQTSNTLLVESGEVTINQDTLLVGWKEFVVDVSAMTRTSISSVGFYTSTDQGWNTNRVMVFNVDNMYLTTGNQFVENGTAQFIYGDSIPKDFYRIEWESLDPSNTSIQIRTRLANDPAHFDPSYENQPEWNNIIIDGNNSGTIVNPTGNLYQYVQIEALLTASTSKLTAPELFKIDLFARNVADLEQFTYDTQEQWESGTLSNIDTISEPGSITPSGVENIDTIISTTEHEVIQLDSEFKNLLNISGGTIPRSTRQIVNGLAPSFGQISGIDFGEDGSFWLADTENDRVLSIDQNGDLIVGFYGSFLEDPEDVYGQEEQGPGSNVEESVGIEGEASETPSASNIDRASFTLIQAVYNPSSHKLSMVFDEDLDISVLSEIDADKTFISIGANRFYLNDATFSMFGIDLAKYNEWIDFSFNNDEKDSFKDQFEWSSHILEAVLPQNEYSAINSVLDTAIPTLDIVNMYEQQIFYTDSVTANLLTSNITLGGSEDYKIAWAFDDDPVQYTYSNSITIDNLTEGLHTLNVYLVDGSNLQLTNVEAQALIHFVYSEANPYTLPYIGIKRPLNNQKVNSSTVGVVFEVLNHVITPTGSHVRYYLDDFPVAIPHYSTGTIKLENLSPGTHEITIYLSDASGDEIDATYSRATVEFLVYNENADMQLFVDEGFMRSESDDPVIYNEQTKLTVDVANIHFSNIFSPIDVQFIATETSVTNPTGEPTVLVAKLRSKSSTHGLADSAPEASEIATSEVTALYDSLFLDGHSVVQLTDENTMLFSNNAGKFAENRRDALRFLGGAEKMSDYHLLVADSVRKRAIITHTDTVQNKTFVAWEYESDRYVSDARSENDDNIVIKIYNDRVESDNLLLRKGTTVIWENYSSNPVYIYSGDTDTERFNNDPDLNLYGDDFQSFQLNSYQAGQTPDRYALKFRNPGTFPYFIYPNIEVDNVVGNLFVQVNNSTNDSKFLIIENDPTSAFFGNRLIKVDMWGNIIWSFGEGMLYNPKDIRLGKNGSYLISV